MRALAGLTLLAACAVPDLIIDGKRCGANDPCPSRYACVVDGGATGVCRETSACGADFQPGPCTAGRGACAALGTSSCDGGAVLCSAVVGEAHDEVCDGLDNDCNGTVDDVASAPLCELQAGVCAGARRACAGDGGFETPCTALSYGSRYQSVESRCDGLDNDCDGRPDISRPVRVVSGIVQFAFAASAGTYQLAFERPADGGGSEIDFQRFDATLSPTISAVNVSSFMGQDLGGTTDPVVLPVDAGTVIAWTSGGRRLLTFVNPDGEQIVWGGGYDTMSFAGPGGAMRGAAAGSALTLLWIDDAGVLMGAQPELFGFPPTPRALGAGARAVDVTAATSTPPSFAVLWFSETDGGYFGAYDQVPMNFRLPADGQLGSTRNVHLRPTAATWMAGPLFISELPVSGVPLAGPIGGDQPDLEVLADAGVLLAFDDGGTTSVCRFERLKHPNCQPMAVTSPSYRQPHLALLSPTLMGIALTGPDAGDVSIENYCVLP